MRYLSVPIAALAATLVACASGDGPSSSAATASERSATASTATAADSKPRAQAAAKPKTIATGLQVPWGIAFLPNGKALVAERLTGRILRLAKPGGPKKVVRRVAVNRDQGEGGLLGIAVSPRYRRDRLIYAYYTTRSYENRIVRFRLGGKARPVLTGLKASPVHNGGRIAFGPDGKLYAGVGDAGNERLSQNRRSQNGKILRMNPDGSVPANNPFDGSRVWSLGHRNVQGLAWDRNGRMWASEFGQDRFDEVNRIRKGRNYGWPVVEGKGSTRGGRFTNPAVTWRPSQASPSGAAIVGNRLYVAALRGEGLWRIVLRGSRVGRKVKLFAGRYGRIRTVLRTPRGALWISTSNRDGNGEPRRGDDRILKVSR